MKTKLLTLVLFLICFYNVYAQKIQPVVKALELDLYGYKTLEERLSDYQSKGYIKSDFKGHPQEPKSMSYQSGANKGVDAIYEIFYNDKNEVYKVSLYFGPDIATWKTFSDEEKMSANNNAQLNLVNMVIKESGKPTASVSFTWDPYNKEDLQSPARFLAGADAKKVGFASQWYNDGDFMHDSPISVETYSSRLIEVSVADWRVQEAARKAARHKK
ncbi:hypothetical protein [Pedobacter miscanthi]|jgi:hypothetical protein|uniref:hypothetical protein n=1 Tax=Pedobacter miscanthi TaxID=2259170 RepID=UPI00292D32D4|nr:hypothetical protein [Pedobacter miscanthi]